MPTASNNPYFSKSVSMFLFIIYSQTCSHFAPVNAFTCVHYNFSLIQHEPCPRFMVQGEIPPNTSMDFVQCTRNIFEIGVATGFRRLIDALF